MKKVLGKYAIVGLIVTMLVSLISINYTVQADDGSIDWGAASTFIEKGKNSDVGGIDSDDLNTIGNSFSEIGQVLTYIGAGVLVGAMAYMGILYMVSPPEKQAKLKQQLIGLVISAVVIFGAYTIWTIVVNLLESVT